MSAGDGATRTRRVAGHGIPAAPQDPDLDRITRLAAALCGAESASVHLLGAGPADAGTDGGALAVTPLRGADGAVRGTLAVTGGTGALDDRQRAALDDLGGLVVHVLEQRDRERHLLDAVGELLRSNDELSAFAGRIAHDLRAPLSAVLGFLALADGPFREESSQRTRECVGSSLDAARRMRHLVDDLLAYATLDARPAPGRVGLAALVDAVVDDLRVEIVEAGARIDYQGPEEVVGDGTLLQQLLANLVGNALRHRAPGVAPRIAVSAVADGPTWRLEVADNGPGIPADQRERVFDPFVRLAGSRRTEGSGIGLATCARIAEALGGRIVVVDAAGGGALFRLTLPAERPLGAARSGAGRPSGA